MKGLFNRLPILILIGSILIILLLRVHLSFVRYFDNDELSHLHWTYLISIGKVPFRDYFFYISPFFQWVLLPLMWLPASPAILILARVYQLIIYLATAVLIALFTHKITKSRMTVILTILLYLAFPMTIDKTIDIRPDAVMIVLFLGALLICMSTNIKPTVRFFLSGLLFSFAIILLPKIIFAAPSLLFFIFINRASVRLKTLLYLLAGGALPALLFFLYLLWHSILPAAIASMTSDAVAVNAGKIPFSALRTLSPWPLVYMDVGGISWPWMVNTSIWVIGVVGLVLLTVRQPKWGIFFLIFFASAIVYIILFPVPYVQYFMPLSIFASFLAAYAIEKILNITTRHFPKLYIAHVALYIFISVSLIVSFFQQYNVRAVSTNDEQLGVIRDVLAVSKPTDTFYDMVGSYVFRPDGYYICCHPFGEFQGKLTKQIPTLRDSLIANKTKFTVMDRTAIAFWQTPEPDLTFLKSNYYTSTTNKFYTLGYHYVCNSNVCRQYDFGNNPLSTKPNSLTIIIEARYKVTTIPSSQTVILKGESLTDGITVLLKPGTYQIETRNTTASVRFQLAQ